jgi:hypothetical protein
MRELDSRMSQFGVTFRFVGLMAFSWAEHRYRRRPRSEETALSGWAYKIRTGESVGELSDWICMTIRPEGRRNQGGRDPSRASCMMRICSSGQDFSRRSLSAKGGQHPEHRVGLGRVMRLEILR